MATPSLAKIESPIPQIGVIKSATPFSVRWEQARAQRDIAARFADVLSRSPCEQFAALGRSLLQHWARLQTVILFNVGHEAFRTVADLKAFRDAAIDREAEIQWLNGVTAPNCSTEIDREILTCVSKAGTLNAADVVRLVRRVTCSFLRLDNEDDGPTNEVIGLYEIDILKPVWKALPHIHYEYIPTHPEEYPRRSLSACMNALHNWIVAVEKATLAKAPEPARALPASAILTQREKDFVQALRELGTPTEGFELAQKIGVLEDAMRQTAKGLKSKGVVGHTRGKGYWLIEWYQK